MSLARVLTLLGGLSGAVAVALGAFAAHALKARLEPEHLQTFETGVRYQMFHTLAILAVAALAVRGGSPRLAAAAWLFAAGIVLFSGSLYLLASRTLLGIEHWRWLGPVTPIGGLCFIAGWVALAADAFSARAP